MSEKRKTYDSRAEFEADRKKMWERGWVVAGHRLMPVVKPSWAMADGHGSVVAWVAMLPLLLLGRLLYRNAPDEQIVVTYVRDSDERRR